MATWVDRWASAWFDATLAAALITGFAALAMIQCRQPARRRAWGRLGLLASLVVIPLAGLAPLPKVDIRHPTVAIWAVDRHASAQPSGLPTGPIMSAARGPVGAAARPRLPWSRAVFRGLLVAYGCGLAIGMGRVGLGVAGSRYLARHALPASDRAAAILAGLPYEGRKNRRPKLLVSERSGRPVLVGWSRPIILIPPHLDRPDAEPQLRLGLLHELAHAEVGDHRFRLIAAVAHATWFFLPQAWWIRNQLRLDAEFLADHRAVGHFGTSYNYAESLVGLAYDPTAGVARLPAAPAGADAAADPPRPSRGGGIASALLQRVQMLLKCPFVVEDRPPPAWSAAVGLLIGGLTLGASCLSTRDWRGGTGGLAEASMGPAFRAFHLAELVIDPQLLEDRPFDLRFRLPDRFWLACEVLAEPAELGHLEVLGYRLGPRPAAQLPEPDPARSAWRRVEIIRGADGVEVIRVEGREVVPASRPAAPASWLTIRPIPGRRARFRDLHLTW